MNNNKNIILFILIFFCACASHKKKESIIITNPQNKTITETPKEISNIELNRKLLLEADDIITGNTTNTDLLYKALANYNSLKDTEFASQAKHKIIQCENMIIKSKRGHAAELFLIAKKMDNKKEREQQLEETLEALEAIISEFPENELAKTKIMQDITIVKKTIELME